MMFVAYEVCRIMTFVAYDVCRLWRLLPYVLWCVSAMRFACMSLMTFVTVAQRQYFCGFVFAFVCFSL